MPSTPGQPSPANNNLSPLTISPPVALGGFRPFNLFMLPTPTALESEYAALTKNVGLVDFRNRTQIELTGADRAQFLHNFSTNVVRDLPTGKGCESFILNVKGHVIGHVYLFVCPNSIVLETVPDQAEKLLAHLDRYLIREDVQFADRSHDWSEFYLAGPQAESAAEKSRN